MLDAASPFGSHRLVQIGDLVSDVATRNPARAGPDAPFTYIDLSAVDRHKTITAARVMSGAEAPSRARQIVMVGDVLVSTVRPNLNGVALITDGYDGAIASTGFCVLRPRPGRLDSSFLFHWVRTPAFVESMTRQATGASYPAVSDGVVRRSLIPAPSYPEQRRIAAILDQADALRAKRRAAVAQLDEMAQAIFVEMFGDPIANPLSLPTRSLRELGRVSTGATPPTQLAGMFGGDIPFITPGDLRSGEAIRRTLTREGTEAARTVRAGAALVCCIGATIGKMDKARSWSAFNQQINAIEWGEQIHDDYGFRTLIFFKGLIAARGASTTLPILKKSEFERIKIPVPTLAAQRSFADRIEALDCLMNSCGRQSSEMDSLFVSLQHRAFRGEL